MKIIVTNIQYMFKALLLLLITTTSMYAADPTISNVKVEVLKHNDEYETQYVKLTYTAKDFATKGSIVKFSVACIGSENFTETPIQAELSGDVGLVVGDGEKSIIWEDEKTLVRLDKQDEYNCNITLSIQGDETTVSSVSLNVISYESSSWNYFNTGLVKMTIESISGLPKFNCSTLGNSWHQIASDAAAVFYEIKTVTDFPTYKGRNPSDKFRGSCDNIGCSSFLAILDYGKPTQTVWANFTKRFVKTVDVNGTNVTQDFEFQFRYYEKGAIKTLSVVNAGKQGQQIINELNKGEMMDLKIETGKLAEVRSKDFVIKVPRREWKYVYKGNHLFTVKLGDKKAEFVGGLLEHHIYLEGGTEVTIGDAIKFSNVANMSIDTTRDNSKITFAGKCLLNGVEIFNLPATTIRLTEDLVFSSPVSLGLAAAAYYITGIAPIIDKVRVVGDPSSPTEALADFRLIFKTFSDGCDIILHPSDNTGGVAFKDCKITPNGWSFPTTIQLNNIGIPTSPDWCLKNLLVSYDKQADKFAFDGVIKAPLFSDIGFGMTFLKGNVEQAKILAKLASGGVPVPIPEPPPLHVALWRGLELEMSNWQTGPKTLRGTMFFANRDDWNQIGAYKFVKDIIGEAADLQIFEAEGTLQGNEFGEFTVDGKIRFFGKIDVWGAQLRGGYSLALNFNQPLIYLGLNNVGIDIAQLGGDKFMMSGTINGSANILPQFVLSGSIRGDIFIPDLFKNHPVFQLINSKLGLPLRLTSAQMMIRNTQGSFDMDLGWLGSWGAWIDISKSPFTEPTKFIGIQKGTVKDLGGIAFQHNGYQKQAEGDTTFVPFTLSEPTNYAYIEIKADVQPSTVVISPSQKVYTNTTSDSLVIFSPASSSADVGLWVLKNPEIGQWKLGVIGKKTGDSIHIWSVLKPRVEFSFTTNQIARTVYCNWDNSKATTNSIVEFYIDSDEKGNDGYRIGTVNETTGSFSYTLSDSLKECGYYIYAVRWEGDRATNFVYSPTYLSNPKKILSAPTNIAGTYTAKNVVNLTWSKSIDPTASFYSIKVTDETGKDSIYATTSADATGIQFNVENPSTKTFSILTNGANQTTGCWAKFPQLVLGVEVTHQMESNNSIEIVPNPTAENVNIYFNQINNGKVAVGVYDLLGRNRLQVESGLMQTGIHSFQLDISQLEQGMYFVRLVSGNSQYSTTMSVIR